MLLHYVVGKMNEADFKMLAGESIFGIADDLLKSQMEIIRVQNDLINRLMDRIDWLEKTAHIESGIKGAL